MKIAVSIADQVPPDLAELFKPQDIRELDREIRTLYELNYQAEAGGDEHRRMVHELAFKSEQQLQSLAGHFNSTFGCYGH